MVVGGWGVVVSGWWLVGGGLWVVWWVRGDGWWLVDGGLRGGGRRAGHLHMPQAKLAFFGFTDRTKKKLKFSTVYINWWGGVKVICNCHSTPSVTYLCFNLTNIC